MFIIENYRQTCFDAVIEFLACEMVCYALMPKQKAREILNTFIETGGRRHRVVSIGFISKLTGRPAKKLKECIGFPVRSSKFMQAYNVSTIRMPSMDNSRTEELVVLDYDSVMFILDKWSKVTGRKIKEQFKMDI